MPDRERLRVGWLYIRGVVGTFKSARADNVYRNNRLIACLAVLLLRVMRTTFRWNITHFPRGHRIS